MTSGVEAIPRPADAEAVAHPVPRRAALSRPGWRLRRRYVADVGVLSGVCYGAVKVGYGLDSAGPRAAVVWLPAGVAIAIVYLGGMRYWPAVLVGGLLATDSSGLPLGSALGQPLGTVLGTLATALLLRRIVARGSPLDSVGGVGRLLAAVAAGTALTATVGSLSLRAGHVITSGAVPDVWRTWWLGSTCGALVVVPLALAWYGSSPRAWASGRRVEAALMLAAVAGMSELIFRGAHPWPYLVFPALGWAALRFGRRGATLAIAAAVGVAAWNTTHSQGPFDSIPHGVVNAQLYIAVAALSTLCLAAVVSERRRFAAGLDASRARLVTASDTERRRLEHNLHDGAQQRLSALAMRLGMAAAHARDAHEPGAPFLDAAGEELTLAIDELRELAHGIHPAALTDLGLAAAITSVAARSTVPVTVELPLTRFGETSEATAYYLITEALTNAQKHAHASSMHVRATTTPRTIHLEVVDDGVGGAAESAGTGLKGLRDRVEALGGTFEIDSAAGHGTRVVAAIPAARRPPR